MKFCYSIISFILIAAATFPISVHGQKKDKKRSIIERPSFTENTALVNRDDLVKAEAYFIEGMKYFVLEDYQKANELFLKCHEITPNANSVQYQIAKSFFRQGEYQQALPYAKSSLKGKEENIHYYELLADIYRMDGQYGEVVNVYEKLLSKTEGSEEYYFDLAAAHLQQSQYKKAIQAYDEAEKRFGVSEAVVRQKQRIYLNIDEVDAALQEGEKLIIEFPSEEEFALSQAQLLINYQRIDEAIELLEKLTEKNPENAQVDLLKADIYLLQENFPDYLRSLKIAFSSSEVSFNKKYRTILEFYQERSDPEKLKQGLNFASVLVDTHPNEAKAHEIYGDFLLAANEKVNARNYLLKSIDLDSDNFKIWQSVLRIDWDQSDFKAVAEHSDKALEIYPNQVLLYLYNGSANYMLKEYEEAMAMLEQGKMFAASEDVMIQLNSQLGDVYHALEEYEKSDEAYESVLAIAPQNVHVLNNYSYYLALRNEKLDKAKSLASKLIELKPNNASYLDTYGWVLFIAGEFSQAIKYLEQAVALSDSNATIIEHYGDVLYKLGDVENALEQWKKAKSIGEGYSDELDRKLAEKRLFD